MSHNKNKLTPIREFPAQAVRVESGPIRFGDDWPGCFFRGDDALGLAFYLASALERAKKKEGLDPVTEMQLNRLVKMLSSCRA